MSESQTGAGNLKFFEIFEIFKNFEILNFVNIKNDPRDMLNNFCFHVYAQKLLFIDKNETFCRTFSATFFVPIHNYYLNPRKIFAPR